eukprot:TRINITY_DN16672_c0_g1_i3.p1 TRINITY_DN16672_c0_g1~~TRINITY_DN16672_c0_g1_i3.p1  ORF type:complete len:538 (+),score=101.98 TRINITY_DN16672_c0_g1_i3:93-1616(+)
MRIDLTNANRIDHRATVVEAEASYCTNAGLLRRPGIECDPGKLADPTVLEKITEEIEAYPPISWTVEPTSHLAIINEQLRTTLATHAPRGTRSWPEWMGEDTKAAVDMKAAVYRSICWSHNGQRKAWCRALFDLWKLLKTHGGICEDEEDQHGECPGATNEALTSRSHRFVALLKTIWRERAVVMLKREHLVVHVKDLVKRDKQKHLDEVLQGVEKDITTSRAREAFKAVRRLKPFKPRPLPFIRLKDGKPAKDAAAARLRWQEHWQERFDATPTSMEEILDEHYRQYTEKAHAGAQGDIAWVPSPEELARSYRLLKKGKKAGEDGVPSDLYSRAPELMARLMHPLCTKSVVTMTTPLQLQGAAVLELPKNQEVKTVAGYRAINVADSAGKPMFRHLRSGVVSALRGLASPLTCGALPGRGIEMAGHFVHSMVRTARNEGKFLANVFIDLSAAFDEVSRQSLFGLHEGAFAKAGAQQLSQLVASAHETTWITVQGCSSLLRTKTKEE